MPIKQTLTDQRVPVKIWTDDVDERSKQQLSNIASLPFQMCM
jgi:tRNA-splicing ligase RtcB